MCNARCMHAKYGVDGDTISVRKRNFISHPCIVLEDPRQ